MWWRQSRAVAIVQEVGYGLQPVPVLAAATLMPGVCLTEISTSWASSSASSAASR